MSGEGRKIRRQIIVFPFTILFVCFLDQLSKFWARNFLVHGSSVPVIRGVLHMTLVYNTGAAFGMLDKRPRLFVFIAVFSISLIVYFLTRRSRMLNAAEKTALCFIMGGTIGNLVDRVRFGGVIDFIDLRIWPVFNLADSFITTGAFILGVSLFVRGKRREKPGDKY
ncbi:MAG: signal peptidase II [Candidatus Omnitrophota bacterium]|nr:signal peptidase II [Candidatus Omnitrophota bacterium]